MTRSKIEAIPGLASLATMAAASPLLVFVAGYGNSGAGHWQRLWHEAQPNSRWVEQDHWDQPSRPAWIAGIERTIAAADRPVFFVTHSLGGLAVVAWSRTSSHPVAGALLVAVPDPDQPDFPPAIHGFAGPTLAPLRFPAHLVASTNDPYCHPARSAALAAAWGADLTVIGPCGHINAASGLKDWPAGHALLARLQAQPPTVPAGSATPSR